MGARARGHYWAVDRGCAGNCRGCLCDSRVLDIDGTQGRALESFTGPGSPTPTAIDGRLATVQAPIPPRASPDSIGMRATSSEPSETCLTSLLAFHRTRALRAVRQDSRTSELYASARRLVLVTETLIAECGMLSGLLANALAKHGER